MKIKSKSKFWMFFIIYVSVLCFAAIGVLLYVHSLLSKFEAAQPERVVETQINVLKEAAENGKLESVLPMTEEVKALIADEKYPKSYVDSFINGNITYKQDAGSYGANGTTFSILSDGKTLARVTLDSTNEHTEMVVFTSADWELIDCVPVAFKGDFVLPSSITVKVNGDVVDGVVDKKGNVSYSLKLLCDADVELIDIFGNSEKQYEKVRTAFYGDTIVLPSNFDIKINGKQIPDSCISSEMISDFEYVSEYTDMPVMNTYNIKYLPTDGVDEPVISILDNVGNLIEYKIGDKLTITEQTTIRDVPEELIKEARILDFAKKWSLFMTNDLSGGLPALSEYLIKDSYLYNVAYKWATGVDRTFTSIHRLYNPPFSDERISNFVEYSENCFSCDVYLVKRMRIANGLDVDDVLSRKLFFVKLDTTNDGKDNAKWVVADMLGAETSEEISGGDSNE